MTLPRLVTILLTVLLSWSYIIVNASPAKNWTQIGDSAYSRKLYDSALNSYRQALKVESRSPILFYKLGNAHYRLGQTGDAVFNFEKALQIQPDFSPASENLRIIQSSLMPSAEATDVFFLRWWNGLTQTRYGNTWALLAALCFCIPLLLLSWSRWRKVEIPWLWPHWTVSGIFLSVLFAVLAVSSLNRPDLGTAVVMRPDAPFNPGTKSGAISLPEGLVVRILREEKNGLLVSLADGRKGIIQPSDIAVVK